MRSILVTIFLACVIAADAQKANEAVNLKIDTVDVGTRLDGSTVKAQSQQFGRRIERVRHTDGCDYLLIEFRETTKSGKWLQNKGEIGLFSLKDKRLRWTQPVNYRTQSFICTSQGVLLNSGNKTTLLSLDTGEAMWRQPFAPVQVDDSLGIVLGYPTPLSSKLSGFNIATGEKMWTAKVSHEKNWGWNEVIREDSTHLMIVADDLCRLNVLTGETEIHDAKNGVDDVKGMLLQGLVMAVGAAAGAAASGGVYVPYGSIKQNVVTSLHSNVLPSGDSCFFFADRERVCRLDSHLQTVWQYSLPSRTAARSFLTSNDSTLFMISLGYGLLNGQKRKKMGRPFIATFDKRSGECRSMNMLTIKKDIVEDAVLTPDGVFLLFDDGMAYKKNLTDSIVDVTPWDAKANGSLSELVTIPVYAWGNLDSMFELIATDGYYYPVFTSDGSIFMVDHHLHICNHYSCSSLYIPITSVGDRLCVTALTGQPDMWLISVDGIPEIHITAPCRRVGLAGGFFFLHDENRLMYID